MPRPRGLAKTGGRQSGTPNKNTAILKEIAQPYTAAAISTLVRIMNGEKYPAQARVAAAAMLMDRAWGRPHQTSDVTVNETQHYVRAPSKVSDDEWKQVLEQRQATLESLVPKPKPKPIEAKTTPKLN